MRIVRGEDFVKGRSHCTSCGHELSAADLVPVFSFCLHKGKCRYCGEKISLRYPLTELFFMTLSLGLYVPYICFCFGNPITFFKYWFLTGCLFVTALTDLEIFEIPDGVLITGGISWIIFTGAELFLGIHDVMWVLNHLLACVIIAGVMLLLSLIMDKIMGRDSLGGGDIKLFALLGLYLGYGGSYELIILSCVLGLIFALIRKILLPNASKEFPFGPSLAFAGYLLLIFGDRITDWYLGLFF